MINSFLGSHLKYHMDEFETFKELHTYRENLKNTYLKNQRNLLDKKEKFFKKQEVEKWSGQGEPSMIVPSAIREELLINKDKAFSFMLPKET
eukprot:CAMPEP_0170553090 /NCGR_PEP_ID=MMETSP0211-20121228/10937_1 /TAXON_ID=311385 /ORGANISM="Pseudokeronopsis sp., Strain OXSARD2" /LENGTH=91 /DNA_ID=CAMNT_0010861219 /DNA_START=1184 /DNA_END=1459 /DNA_ORIENTATION=+